MPWQRRMFAVATPRTWQILLVIHCKWLGKCTGSGKGGINRRNWSTKKIMDNTKTRTRMMHHIGARRPTAREMLELLTMVKESKVAWKHRDSRPTEIACQWIDLASMINRWLMPRWYRHQWCAPTARRPWMLELLTMVKESIQRSLQVGNNRDGNSVNREDFTPPP